MSAKRYWMGEPQMINDLAAPMFAAPSMYGGMPHAAPYSGYHPVAYGAPWAQSGRTPMPGYGGAAYAPGDIPYRRIMPTIPGVPALGFRDQAVGLGTATFTATSGTALPLTGAPGRPFKGRRLMLDTTRSGTTATGLLTITGFLIGDANQLVGRGSLLVSAYAPGAFGADGQYSACAPALSISLTITNSLVPTSPDTITIAGQFNGETIGG